MSKIAQLLCELCPNGVEYKQLWEVTYWDKRFNGVEKYKQKSTISYKHVSAAALKNLDTGIGDVKLLSTGKYDGWTTTELAGGNLCDGEVLTIPSGGSASIKYYAGRFVDSGNIIATASDHSTVELKYLYYYLLNINEIIEKSFRGSGVKHPSMNEILDIKVPIPPLQVQRAIIDTLDLYTGLEANLEMELKSELKARNKQFELYRDELLTFSDSDGVDYKPLGEIGQFIRGKRFTKADYVDDGIGVIHYGEIYTHYGVSTSSVISHVRQELRPKLRFAKQGDVVIAAVGETVEDVAKAVAWMGNEDVAIHDDCFAYRHSLNPKYVSYYFQTAMFHSGKNKYVARAKVKRISSEGLGKITIPVPTMQEQNKVVSILDNFDKSISNISSDLPAEISARRKQYEYYRNKLLTFQELPA